MTAERLRELRDALGQTDVVRLPDATSVQVFAASELLEVLTEYDALVTRLGMIILAERRDKTVGDSLRAAIRSAESEFFNLPTPEGAYRRDALRVVSREEA